VGAFLKEPTRFDNLEFGIATKDALSMTASTRRLIELTFLACLDSGIDSRGKRIGVFNAGTNVEAFELVRFGAIVNDLCSAENDLS
jgi:acyl transferase domain-containing protein